MTFVTSKRQILTGVLAAAALAGIAASAPAVASANAAPVAKPASTAAASLSTTRCWGGVPAGAIPTWNGAPVAGGQAVVVSATEASAPSGGEEFNGAANVYSEGVAVVPNAIAVRVHTGWSATLNVRLHYVS